MPKRTPTDTELQVLSVLWDQGPATARKVLERMPDGKKRSYTTVLAIMQVMEKKGLLSRRLEGRAHVYRPVQGRDRLMKPVLRTLVKRVFKGRPTAVVQQLLRDQSPSKQEIAEIRALLDELDGQA